MVIIPPALGAVFAAFVVWLVVRLVNRRQRWTKWTMLAVVGMPVVYVLSFAPVCWISSRFDVGRNLVGVLYRPFFWIILDDEDYTTVPWHIFCACAQFGADPAWRWHAFALQNPDGTCDTKPDGSPYLTPWEWGPVQ